MELKDYIKQSAALIDEKMDLLLPAVDVRPATIHKAMRYSLFAGGKKMRGVLCLAAAEACGGDAGNALYPASAVEMIHTYSLIHDDLPCMDNDDLRRGKPTSHKIFGEGIALLAGDALLTEAFAVLANINETDSYTVRDFLAVMAAQAGSRKLIGGQVLDLEGEGRQLTIEEVDAIHHGKTAALISCSAVLGGMSANGTTEQIDALRTFGECLGRAFQIIDDILDITSSSEAMGKTVGKDVASAKSTYPAIIGLEASREAAGELTGRALDALSVFEGNSAMRLKQLAEYLLMRDY